MDGHLKGGYLPQQLGLLNLSHTIFTMSNTIIHLFLLFVKLGAGPGNRTPICGFGDRCNAIIPDRHNLERDIGIEPMTKDWKSLVLPLN